MTPKPANLVVIVTGSIAAYKACEVVSDLVQRGHRLRVVMTEAALRFVGATTFEGLTGEPVLSDLFAPGTALEHIRLGRWADAILVCPATAQTMNRMAAGLADDLPGALFLAHDRTKPFLFAPAMNPLMWSHPATVASVARLASWGAIVLPAAEGRTACGEIGEGRLAEPAAIVAGVEAALAQPARRLKVLITSGGTAEPVDGVRVLTNASTGETGAQIADHFTRSGHEVVLVRARNSAAPAAPCREEPFTNFNDLSEALARLLRTESFDAVIHAAAVGDFAVESASVNGVAHPAGTAKLGSSAAPVLHLRIQPKLVNSLKNMSRNPDMRLVAFKLTCGADETGRRAAVASLFDNTHADFIVHNDLDSRGETSGAFPADIYGPAGSLAAHCPTRPELAATLERILAAPANN